MRPSLSRSTLLMPALLLAATAAPGCSSARGFCAAQAECDDVQAIAGFDAVGEDNDSVDVCVARWDGVLAELRANEEDICHEQALALEAYMACVERVFTEDPENACDGLKLDLPFIDSNNPCEDERDDYIKLVGDADDDCSRDEE